MLGIHKLSGEWVKSFDIGDMEQLHQVADELTETMKELTAAAEAASELGE